MLITMGVTLPAQNGIQLYPFINYEADTLVFNPETSKLSDFFLKYDSLVQTKKGEINILHIGGSHVQAGTFPHTIRQKIVQLNPELMGHRGMIFPYSAAPRSNNPIDYQVRSVGSFQIIRNVFENPIVPLGVTGVAVTTIDTMAEIKIILKDSTLTYITDRIILLGKWDSSMVIPSIWVDSLEYFPIEIDTLKNRFTYEPLHVTDSFTIRFNNYNGERFILNGIYLENDLPGVTFHSIGVNGASVPAYLRCVNFERDLDLIRPDLVIFGIGINDASGPNFNPAEFEANYLTLIEIIKKQNPDCVFIFVTNNDSFKRVKKGKKWHWVNNTNGKEVQKVMYDLAQKTNGAVFDQYKIMGGAKSMAKWVTAGLAQKDRVHFTKSGYQLMGELFFNAFLDAKNKSDQYNSKKSQ
jgi:lysophospholipase L1-like esterase